jgi:hypothetical protein
VYIFARPGSLYAYFAFMAFLRLTSYGLFSVPIESAFDKGVYLELFAQARPASMGESWN